VVAGIIDWAYVRYDYYLYLLISLQHAGWVHRNLMSLNITPPALLNLPTSTIIIVITINEKLIFYLDVVSTFPIVLV
jgi:hypothetical protein